MKKETGRFLSILLVTIAFLSCEKVEERKLIADEINRELERKIEVWYPGVLDLEYGGYLSNFSHDWIPADSQEKMIVSQSRHIWTLSKLAGKYPDLSYFKDYAEHGYEFLRDYMWDSEYGGFFQMVNRQGEPVPNEQGEFPKTLYGNAFALYGLSAYYGISQDTGALDLATQLFNWLDAHSYDPESGGYFQPLARDGTPETSGYPKDYNSGIHILEALTEFYSVWPDETVRERLGEMFTIVRDTMVTEQGYLKLYFARDWEHRSYRDSTRETIMENIGYDHITPGHDIETAYLLLEAVHVLGMKDDEKTLEVAKKLTDHTIRTGWDNEVGGFYETGYYFDDEELTILNDSKNWWAQAEGFNTLLIMADYFPDDPLDYESLFYRQWNYIQTYLSDQENGGWFNYGLDKTPESIRSRKSHIWKGNYHTLRALLGTLERLNKDAETENI